MIKLVDNRPNPYQWDTNAEVEFDGLCDQFHFANRVYGRSINVKAEQKDGKSKCLIPIQLLQVANDLNVFVFVGTAESGQTKVEHTFKVMPRNKPNDYVFTPAEQMTIEEIEKIANESMQTSQNAMIVADNAITIAESVKDDRDAGLLNGKSAYQVAVDNGFVGTEQEWLESLKIDLYQVPLEIPADGLDVARLENANYVIKNRGRIFNDIGAEIGVEQGDYLFVNKYDTRMYITLISSTGNYYIDANSEQWNNYYCPTKFEIDLSYLSKNNFEETLDAENYTKNLTINRIPVPMDIRGRGHYINLGKGLTYDTNNGLDTVGEVWEDIPLNQEGIITNGVLDKDIKHILFDFAPKKYKKIIVKITGNGNNDAGSAYTYYFINDTYDDPEGSDIYVEGVASVDFQVHRAGITPQTTILMDASNGIECFNSLGKNNEFKPNAFVFSNQLNATGVSPYSNINRFGFACSGKLIAGSKITIRGVAL